MLVITINHLGNLSWPSSVSWWSEHWLWFF